MKTKNEEFEVKNISEVTRRDLFDLFSTGIKIQDRTIYMPLYGRLDEIEFLSRLYNLKELPSYDPRYKSAAEDIHANSIDWKYNWIFYDDRFMLLNGEDKYLLDFICEIFHPAVRNEKKLWKEFFVRINCLLQDDGYELFEKNVYRAIHIMNGELAALKIK